MAEPQVIPRLSPPQVIEGTPQEIAVYLERLNGDTTVTLIIPGKELESVQRPEPTKEQTPHPGMTFAEILAPAERGFEECGMTEEELDEFIEAEVKAYRAEKRARDQPDNG